jgi:plastocyanin
MRIVHIAAVVAVLIASGLAVSARAAEHVVSQKNKAFGPKKLNVQAGDTIKFVNDDPFAHNVFSLSDTKSFDLGSWGAGVSKSVVLDQPGLVEVECAVHPDMRMVIEVRK